MTSQIWNRRCTLTVAPPSPRGYAVKEQNALVLDGMRIRFSVKRTRRREPNAGWVEVYNLSPDSRGQIQGKGVRAWLGVGYGDQSGALFIGDVRYVEHTHRDTEWVTRLELGDGWSGYVHGRASRSYPRGTTKAQILRDLITDAGWDTGNLSAFLSSLNVRVPNGYCAWGRVADEVERIMAAHGLEWSIQNGAIQIMPRGGSVARPAIQIDEDHGMIGVPEHGAADKRGGARPLKVRCLLDADKAGLVPGALIYVSSQTIRGTYSVRELTATGDTHGDEWYADIEAVPA